MGSNDTITYKVNQNGGIIYKYKINISHPMTNIQYYPQDKYGVQVADTSANMYLMAVLANKDSSEFYAKYNLGNTDPASDTTAKKINNS